jgi:hypothetical protein
MRSWRYEVLITLSANWTGPRGGVHKPDETLEVPDVEARELLHRGLARRPATTEQNKEASEND